MTDSPTPSSSASSMPALTEAEDRQWASFAHLGGILGILPALIIYVIFKDRGSFTNVEGKEALNFQITALILEVVSYVLMVVGIGFLLLPLVYIARLVFSILGFVKAKDGANYRYPIAIRLLK
jgi:uncharacterized protein